MRSGWKGWSEGRGMDAEQWPVVGFLSSYSLLLLLLPPPPLPLCLTPGCLCPTPPHTSRPQVPSLEEIWWVSAIGTASSLGYVFIALILGIYYGGNREGSVGGCPGTSPANKAFGILNALGNIAFAYGFAQVSGRDSKKTRCPPSVADHRESLLAQRARRTGGQGSFVFLHTRAIAFPKQP